MVDVVLISPPAIEPVTLQDVKDQARVYHSLDDNYISNTVIPAARAAVEDELHRALINQTWLIKLDGFPGKDPLYESRWYPEILLPKPPLHAILSFTYVDTAGVTQTLYECLPDGTTPTINGVQQYYGYQVDPGSETQPGRLLPPWARPCPPARLKPFAVQIKLIAGYGTLIKIGIQNGSDAITGAIFYPSDVGLAITIVGAGVPAGSPLVATDLVTTIASVDSNGTAHTADTAGATVSAVPIWWRRTIPEAIKQGILLQCSHLYENRSATTAQAKSELARGVSSLIGPYINRVA